MPKKRAGSAANRKSKVQIEPGADAALIKTQKYKLADSPLKAKSSENNHAFRRTVVIKPHRLGKQVSNDKSDASSNVDHLQINEYNENDFRRLSTQIGRQSKKQSDNIE